MKTATERLLPFLLCIPLLAGCAAANTDFRDPRPQEVAEQADIPQPVSTDAPEEGFASFAVELLRKSRQEGENTLLSPFSVMTALGMTADGASGRTAEAFEELFATDTDTLNAWCAQLLKKYSDLGGSTQSTLANSLWCDPKLTLTDSFVSDCRQHYDAALFHADLQDAGTVKAVNKWVDKATKGLIPDAVERFSPDAVLVLVNAIYLKNRFEQPFETPVSDWEMDFTAADGTISHPKGMHNGGRNEWYVSHGKGSGVILPYDDGRLGFLLMLPDEGTSITDYLASWDGDTIRKLLNSRESRLTYLTVPKYELGWGGSLVPALSDMGVADAFHPDTADFRAMGTSQGGPLFIGDVIHKTMLKVNEKGTEAAAVTAVTVGCGAAMPPEDLINLRFDRPFVCGIIDLETGAPLFLGTVEDLS